MVKTLAEERVAVVKLDMALEVSSARLVILVMPNGQTVAGRVEVLNEKLTKVSDLVAKHKR